MKKFLLLILFTCTSYAAFSSAVVSQKDWRWRKDDDTEAAASWSAAENQSLTKNICADETLRLRMSFFVQFDGTAPGTFPSSRSNDYRISYATSINGTYTLINKPSSTANAEHFILSGSDFVSNGQSTTQQLSTALSAGVGFIPGTIVDSNMTGTINFTTPSQTNSVSEYEWIIKPTVNAQAQTYYFKLDGLNGTYATLPELTYNPAAPSSSSATIIACDSYTSPDGSERTESGTYIDVIPNYLGCDSTITTDLTINTTDASVTLNGETLTADNASATYQWVDCDNGYAEIDGETDQSFTPTNSGYYAVVVTENTCEKMSLCTNVSVVTGISDNTSTATMLVHPNPSNGNFVVEATKVITLEIYSPAGQLVLSKTVEKGNHPINLDAAGNGIYFLTATDANGNRTSQKIVLSK